MEIGNTLDTADRKAWRQWLERNHFSKKEMWLVFHKKHTGRPSIPYSDAVEEALCFGWIDSIVKTIDKDSYAQRFTPRRPGSEWSELNKERLRKLIRQGSVPASHLPSAKVIVKKSAVQIAPDIARALKDASAWENFLK